MKLSELIKKNNEEFDENVFMRDVNDYREAKHFITQSQHSLLNNILEYIDGEKKKLNFVEPTSILEGLEVGHNEALQLIEGYITETLTK